MPFTRASARNCCSASLPHGVGIGIGIGIDSHRDLEQVKPLAAEAHFVALDSDTDSDPDADWSLPNGHWG
jgi:hypothetical protein